MTSPASHAPTRQGRRVAITGVGITCPLGTHWEQVFTRVCAGQSSVVAIPDMARRYGLSTHLGSPVLDFDEKALPRQLRRSMSRVALFAVDATTKAVKDAGLTQAEVESERTGISYGSTMGGTSAIEKSFQSFLEKRELDGVMSSTFLQIMSHTCGANIAIALGVKGRMLASSTACASALQAIGFGYETIRYGLASRMLCGGAEELHPFMVGVFDTMRATSVVHNANPQQAPRPFSKDRDGLVVGEGAGTLVLEDWEQAKARGAHIYAEVVGFHTNSDGGHMTNPSVDGMERVMRNALTDAGLEPQDMSSVNAHGTATLVGDIAESRAIHRVFGEKVPVSTYKGHFGHLMGACGAVESIVCLGMMRENKMIPTLHLEEVDPECAPLNYVRHSVQDLEQSFILKNSFGFGGVNATLILKKA